MEDFEITSVCREDVKYAIKNRAKDEKMQELLPLVDKLTDAEMMNIAEKMGKAYVGQGFWDDLSLFAEQVLKDKKLRDEVADH